MLALYNLCKFEIQIPLNFYFYYIYWTSNFKYHSKFNISSFFLSTYEITFEKTYSLKTFHQYQICALIFFNKILISILLNFH